MIDTSSKCLRRTCRYDVQATPLDNLTRFALLAALPFAAAAQPLVQPQTRSMSATAMFSLADRATAASRLADAEAIYRALAHDPDPEIRAEARFRLGMMLAAVRRYRDAAIAFRALLDEKPDANRVRLELARVMALMGDEDGARRQLRQAQAAGLPPDVAVTVGRFANALRSNQRFGGSFELSVMPDSNINRATRAATLDTVIAPLTLDKDARAHSGIGVKLNGEAYLRWPVAPSSALLLRAFGSASLYGQHQFNDISAGFSLGPEIRLGGDRIRPAVGVGRRYYAGDLYARTVTASANWLHPIGRRDQLVADLSGSRVRYPVNRFQDGAIYDAAIGLEHGFSAKSGASINLLAGRQSARDPGYAMAYGGASVLLWRDIGSVTLYATGQYRRLEADERLSLYPRRRIDDYARLGVGASFRSLSVAGLAPVVRIAAERNRSTVGLYDYRRLAVDIGIIRSF